MTYCIKNYLKLVTFILMSVIFGAAYPDSSPSQWLTPHNNARKAVGVPALTWDAKLAKFAKSYAEKRKKDCSLVHSTGPYGENMFWRSSKTSTPSQAVAGWLSEKRGYNAGSNTCRIADCGHYTQIVWRSTTKVGCAKVECEGGRGGAIFVCEYDPPGNFYGEKPY
ncbi:hypothetical protein RND81_07G083300 [Saponaria officinalis]|uniref:SCP domain-containing protein n=1 Tax=Saponaria officinalis TaxID=3572 RepID=A0AAW1JN64_SAPOF